MEVIKHGNTYKEIECTNCKALLSYCKVDIRNDNRDDNFFWEKHYSRRKYIICPECREEINLSWIIDGEETISKEKTC